jgi:plastocyanin
VTGAAATFAPAPAPPARVELRDFAFTPAVVRVRTGRRVTWTWRDGPYVLHDLRSVGRPRFRGSAERREGSYTVRFTRAGTYRYLCTLHAGMTGRVVVRDARRTSSAHR